MLQNPLLFENLVPRSGNILITSGIRLGSIGDILGSLGVLSGMAASNTHRDDGFESLLNYLMTHDPNNYGNPPASKNEVEKLEKIIIKQDDIIEFKQKMCIECSVCKDEFEENQEINKLPCGHLFHIECVIPWLKQRNSCPTCRFELPTDDADYEKRRKKTI